MNLLTIFITGLLTGGLTCLAVQGGLLATTIAQRKGQNHALSIIFFLAAKIIAYTILGFFLGWFGSLFQLNGYTRAILQIIVGVYMVGIALNLLNVHPFFRYFLIQPPKFLTRLIRKESKSSDFFAPFLLGAFTVFIPCGTTQAIMALAIASQNPLYGALILLAFTLGTSPLFFTLGYLATKLGAVLQDKFIKIAGVVIIILAVISINSGLALTGSRYTLGNLWNNFYCTALAFCSNVKGVFSGNTPVNKTTIYFENYGYNPDNITVKAGTNVTLQLTNKGGRGCLQAFTIPKLGIEKIIPVGKSETIQFQIPQETEDFYFMCSMGMYRGTIHVI